MTKVWQSHLTTCSRVHFNLLMTRARAHQWTQATLVQPKFSGGLQQWPGLPADWWHSKGPCVYTGRYTLPCLRWHDNHTCASESQLLICYSDITWPLRDRTCHRIEDWQFSHSQEYSGFGKWSKQAFRQPTTCYHCSSQGSDNPLLAL